MRKKFFRWAFALVLAVVFSGCSFSPPDSSEKPAAATPEIAGEREYLTVLKAVGNFTIGETELERQVLQLLNPQTEGRSTAPGEQTVITGSKKLPVSGQRIANRSSYARSAASEHPLWKSMFLPRKTPPERKGMSLPATICG